MIGQQISHYRILEHLGRGGMGEVFKAADLRLERRVALKFLPPALGENPIARERFMQEAKSASALDHANICTIYEVDQADDGRLFIAMAFYDGESLRQRLASGPQGVDAALEVAEQVAEGLVAAHRNGIVHRDIKPANLMVTRDGVVKIVDFGLAKLAEGPGLTKTGTSVGTPAYMSPEQVSSRLVDHRTDIWSLGIVLYEMLTGRRPFQGATDGELVHAILYEDPPDPSSIRRGIPPAVRDLLKQLLARDAAGRCATAQDALGLIRAAKQAAGNDERSGAVASPDTPTATRWRTEQAALPKSAGRRVTGPVVAVLAVLGVAVGFAGWWLAGLSAPGAGPDEARSVLSDNSVDERTMIVVLPFDNLGAEEDAYFAAGVTEEVTSRLARIGALGVISRNTAVHYDAAGKSMRQIGRDLGVDFVLQGTVRWAPRRRRQGSRAHHPSADSD